jgi:PKD repeat protein
MTWPQGAHCDIGAYEDAAKAITAFDFTNPAATGVIVGGNITVTVPYGTNVTALVPTITHNGASINPASGIAQNFTNPIVYTVTAVDGTTRTYTVTVTVALNSAKSITAFTIPSQVGGTVINETAGTIAITMPFGTNVTALIPTITHTGASINPASGVPQNLTNPIGYTVTAADASAKVYTVTVTVALNPAKSITAFTVPGQAGNSAIDDIAGTIVITVPYGTDVTALVPTITYTGASISPASGVPQNFTNPIGYTVTAADGSTKLYTVTILTLCSSPIVVANANDSGAGSLRQAIADVCPGGTITFAPSLSGATILLASQLNLNRNLTIDGSALTTAVTLDGQNTTRVVYVGTGVTAAVQDLMIAHGNSAVAGGGIDNYYATLTVTNTTLVGNFGAQGGGIFNDHGTTTVANSTLADNTAEWSGGGIYNYFGTLRLMNSTLSGNRTNQTYGYGGGLYNYGTLHYTNTIMANSPHGADCVQDGGSIATNINNVVEDGGCAAGGVNFKTGDPKLGALQNNGGRVKTMALLPGSLAIDAGANCLSTDERGVARPQGSACDIGAFESRGFTLSMGTGSNQSATINTTFSIPLGVTVTSAYDEPVDGGVINFVGPFTGAGINPIANTAIIASNGAVSRSVTANGIVGGPYTITASASGVMMPIGFTLTNNKISTTSRVGSAPNPATYGQPATFTATVTSTVGTPSGTVQFYADGITLGGAQSLTASQATYSTSMLEAGTHLITVTYSGDANYNISTSSAYSHTVNKASTAINLTASISPSLYGQPVTFTATLTSSTGATPTGTVQFYADGTALGSAVVLVNCVAAASASALTAGTHIITATYNGSANFNAITSSPHLHAVNAAQTTTSITSAPNPSLYERTVTFTATVTSVTGATPTGTVQFYADGATLGGVQPLASGIATYPIGTLTVGTHVITATYTPGNSNFYASSGALSSGQTVLEVPITNLNASNSSPTRLTDITAFTATISAGSHVAYQWNLGDGQTATGAQITHQYAQAGVYTALVTATNSVSSLSAVMSITITNQPPVANAGPDRGVSVNAPITLDGSGSTDADGHLPLTYYWTQVGGPAVTVTPNVSVTAFTAPSAPTVLTFTLDVTDAEGLRNLTNDAVVITVSDVAISGLTAVNSSPTRLTDATAFTATISAGTGVTYQWEFGDGQTGSGVTSSHTYAAVGTYTAIVTATNGAGSNSVSTLVTITNLAPIANAGADQSVVIDAAVTLDGSSSSDPDGHLPLTYAWAQIGGPAVTFSPNVSVTTFTTPSAPAVLTFTLDVTDAQGLRSVTADSVVITVGDVAITGLAATNSSPTRLTEVTFFTATISAGNSVTYQWDFGDGQTANGAQITHQYAQAGVYTAVVTATNGAGSISTSTSVTITNLAPIANAGVNQSVAIDAVITLDGSSSSDPDEHLPLTYSWTQIGGPVVTFTPNFSVTTFTAPSAPTVLTFTLDVTDAQGFRNVTDDSVVITVGDVAITGLAATNSSPTRLTQATFFTATISTGSSVTYQWDFGDGLAGSGATTSHTYAATGTYTAIVTATNWAGSTSATTLVAIESHKVYLPLVMK